MKLTTLPPSNTEIKNAWRYTSTPQYVSMALCLVKHWESFTFYLLPVTISCGDEVCGQADGRTDKNSVVFCVFTFFSESV
jgi:hypothetical protein